MKKARKRTKKHLNVRTILVAVFAVYFVFAAVNQQFKIGSLDKNIESLKVKVSRKQKELDSLEDTEKYYSSDEYVEKIAREKLGLVRADETVFVDITGK